MRELPELLRGLKGHGDGMMSPGKDYFEAMAQATIREGQRPAATRSLPLLRWLAAAGLVLLLLGGWIFSREAAGEESLADKPLNSEELLNQLSVEDIDAYIDDQLHDFEPELYAEAPLNQ